MRAPAPAPTSRPRLRRARSTAASASAPRRAPCSRRCTRRRREALSFWGGAGGGSDQKGGGRAAQLGQALAVALWHIPASTPPSSLLHNNKQTNQPTNSYAQKSPGVHQGFEYSRSHNPTRFAFERCVASLENTGLSEADDTTCGGFAFASGLAAAACCMDLLDAGATIVCMDDV